MRDRSITSPPSQTPSPGPLWPPPRTASSRLFSRAKLTAAITSATSAHLAISAGRRSIMRVVDLAGRVVARVARPDQLAAKLRPQLLDFGRVHFDLLVLERAIQRPSSGRSGSSISTRAPSPSRLCIRIVPPRASTTLRAMASPSPVPRPLRREERLEDVGQVPRGNSGSLVRDPEQEPAAPSPAAAELDAVDGVAAAGATHGLPRVLQQVREDGMEPLAVGDDRARFGIEREADVRAFQPSRMAPPVPHQRRHVHGRTLDPQGPSEVEDVGHDPVEPCDLADDVHGRVVDVVERGALPLQLADGRLDDHQRIAQLVGDHRGDLAERRQPHPQRRLVLQAGDRARHHVEGAVHQLVDHAPKLGRGALGGR